MNLFTWVMSQGYWIVFLGMCVEGPAVTVIASFAAAMGHFNIWWIAVLAVLGDIIPDTIYYYLGHFGGKPLVHWWEQRSGPPLVRLEKIMASLEKNSTKAIILLKFTPVISVLGFIMLGVRRWSFRKYITLCFAATVPKVILLAIGGYFAGNFLKDHEGYLQRLDIVLFGIVVLVVGVPLLYKRLAAVITARLEKKL